MNTISIGTKLAETAAECGIALNHDLIRAFAPFYEQAAPLVAEAATVSVTALDQLTEMKKSRELRLKLRPIRTAADKLRSQMKEESLRTSANIEKVAQTIIKSIKAEEDRLDEQEKFAVRAEAARKAKLNNDRSALLRPYGVDPSFYQLGDMPADQFAQLLDSSRIAFEAKQEAARKADEERKAAEEARAAEDRRIREENARLAREKAEQEATAKREREEAERVLAEERRKADEAAKTAAEIARKEREAAEAEVRREREAREKIEAEQRKKAEAEEKARRRAAAAPDREKVVAYAASLRAIELPSLTDPAARDLLAKVSTEVKNLADRIEAAAARIGGAA